MKETTVGFGRAAFWPHLVLAHGISARTANSNSRGLSNDWHEITGEDEAFFLRVYGPEIFGSCGADLGILVTKGRMQTAEGLTPRCRHYIDGSIRNNYQSEPLPYPPL